MNLFFFFLVAASPPSLEGFSEGPIHPPPLLSRVSQPRPGCSRVGGGSGGPGARTVLGAREGQTARFRFCEGLFLRGSLSAGDHRKLFSRAFPAACACVCSA